MMKNKKYIYILLFLLCFVACNSRMSYTYKPKNIDECYMMLDKRISKVEKDKIRNSVSVDIMSNYHLTIGLYIRNEWIRHGNSELIKQINYKNWKVQIDDLGSIILNGYWYYLHKSSYKWENDLDNAEKYYKSNKKGKIF